MEFYIAFSIHGSNTFIVATKNVDKFSLKNIDTLVLPIEKVNEVQNGENKSVLVKFDGADLSKVVNNSTSEIVVVIDDETFKVGKSRDHNKKNNSVKLLSCKLLTKKGEPLRSPPMILKFFNDLQRKGWNVSKERFIQKHWK